MSMSQMPDSVNEYKSFTESVKWRHVLLMVLLMFVVFPVGEFVARLLKWLTPTLSVASTMPGERITCILDPKKRWR